MNVSAGRVESRREETGPHCFHSAALTSVSPSTSSSSEEPSNARCPSARKRRRVELEPARYRLAKRAPSTVRRGAALGEVSASSGMGGCAGRGERGEGRQRAREGREKENGNARLVRRVGLGKGVLTLAAGEREGWLVRLRRSRRGEQVSARTR